MRIRHFGFFLAIFIISSIARAQTVDEIAQKYLEANGGLANIKAKNSMRMACTITAMGQSMATTITKKRPNKLRTDVEVQGMKIVQAYDGTKAWTQMPMTPQPTEMPKEQAASFRAQAVFDSPMVDFAARGYKIELLGKEAVNGKEAFKLGITAPEGTKETLFIDAEKYLAVKTVTMVAMPEGDQQAEITFSDHRDVGGVMTPHKVVTVIGKNAPMEMKVENLQWDVDVPDTFFAMPQATMTTPKQ